MRLFSKLILAVIFTGLAAGTCAAMETKEMTLSESTLVSLDKAIEMAYQYNLDILQAGTERKISASKLKEARAQRGFSFGVNGNYVQNVGSLGGGFQMPIYTPTAVTALNPATGLPAGPAPAFYLTNGITGATSTASTVTVGANPSVYDVAFIEKIQRGANFVVKKPIYTFGKIENNVRLNTLGVRYSDEELRRKRLDVVLKVKQAYYQCLLAEEFHNVSQESVEQAQAHYDAAKARFDVGATPKFDLIRAEVDVASAKETLAKAVKGEELARMALNNAIGIDVTSPIRVVKPEAEMWDKPVAVDELMMVAVKNRPEATMLKLGQQQAELGARLSRLTPTVGFQGTYSLLNQGTGFGQQDTWQLAVGVEMPMFDSGVAKAKIAQAKQTREKLAQTEEQLKQGIQLQVSEAYLSMKEARARMVTSAATLDLAKEAVRMSDIGYKEGVTTNIDVIDAQHGLNGAKLNNAQASFDFEIAKARLLDALGVESTDALKKALEGK